MVYYGGMNDGFTNYLTDTITDLFREGGFFYENGAGILTILVVVYLLRKFAMIIISRLVRRAIKPNKFRTRTEEIQREDTLISVIGTSVRVGLWVVAGLLLLGEAGVDIGPLLAGAGVAGVALGFGAQSLVKDFLAGMFILVENQYRVGDVVSVNGKVSGVVEKISLRETVLRDLDGMVHHIPNGYIEFATNMTMEFANVNLDVGVGYDTDLDGLEVLINEVGSTMAKDEVWKDRILEAPQMLRVDSFAESAIVVKITGKTAPMKQWDVTGELRKRLKKAFDKAGIEIPFPQRVLHEPKKTKK